MPLSTSKTPTQLPQSDVSEQQQQQPRLVYATTNKHNPQDTIEMTFVVTDENGSEHTIIAKNINASDLFYMTEEGRNWLSEQRPGKYRRVA
jgi:hypothetical protein